MRSRAEGHLRNEEQRQEYGKKMGVFVHSKRHVMMGLIGASIALLGPWGTSWASATSRQLDAAKVASGTCTSVPTVSIAVATLSGDFAPYIVDQNTGIDAKFCVSVDVVDSILPPDIPSAMVAGSVDATGLTGTAARSARKGVPLVVLAQMAIRTSESILAAPGIKKLTTLKGKKIISSPAVDTPTVDLNGILKDKAPSVANNYTLVPVASVSGRDAAFVAHDGTAVMAPLNLDLQMEKQVPGSRILATPKVLPPVASTGLAVTKAYLSTHKTVIENLMKSVEESQHFVKTEPKQAEKVFEKAYHLTPSQAKTFYKYDVNTIDFTLVPTKAELAEAASLFTESNSPGTKPWTVATVRSVCTFAIAGKVDKWWKSHGKS